MSLAKPHPHKMQLMGIASRSTHPTGDAPSRLYWSRTCANPNVLAKRINIKMRIIIRKATAAANLTRPKYILHSFDRFGSFGS